MYGAKNESGSDALMARYGQIYRENKTACEAILGAWNPFDNPNGMKATDLEWLRQHAWRQAQKEVNS